MRLVGQAIAFCGLLVVGQPILAAAAFQAALLSRVQMLSLRNHSPQLIREPNYAPAGADPRTTAVALAC